MKHSKKWISSALVLSLSVGLSACGKANDKKPGKSGANHVADTQWSEGDPCPKVVIDELIANDILDTSAFDKMSREQQIAFIEKGITLTESFSKKYLGRPTCKIDVTLPSGKKVSTYWSFYKNQQEIDAAVQDIRDKLKKLKAQEDQSTTTGGGTTTSPTSDSKKECTPEIQAEAQRLSDSLSDIHVTRNTMLLELKGLDAKSPSYAADWESTVDMGMQSLSYQMSKYIPEEDKFAVDHKGSSACIVVIKKADGKEEKLTQTFPSTDEDAEARVTDRECEFTQLEKDTWKEIQKISDEKSGKKETPAAPVTKSDPEAATSLESSAEVTKQSTTPVTTTPSSQSDDAAAPAKKAVAPAPAKKAVAPAPAKPATAPAKPATAPAKPATAPVKPATAPVKPATAPAKQSTSKAPMCEDALVQDFKKFATSEEANMEGINKNNALAMANKQIDRFESFMKKYVGHPDCMMMEDGKLSLTEFPKSQNELAKLVSDYKKQLKEMVDIVKKL